MHWYKMLRESIFDLSISVVRKAQAATTKSIELESGTIKYLDVTPKNAKATIVMLHGLGADKDTWLKLIKSWNNEYRIIAPDLPGHGESFKDLKTGYGLHNQALIISAFLRHLNIENYHILGHSMGGAIAAKVAQTEPLNINSLILISPYGIPTKASVVELLEKQLGYNPMLEIKGKKGYQEMMNLAMVKKPHIPGFALNVLAEKAQQNSMLYKSILNDCKTESDITAALSTQAAPIMVIWGEDDAVLNVAAVDELKKCLANFELLIMKQTGHVPAVENPEETATQIANFINKHQGLSQQTTQQEPLRKNETHH